MDKVMVTVNLCGLIAGLGASVDVYSKVPDDLKVRVPVDLFFEARKLVERQVAAEDRERGKAK